MTEAKQAHPFEIAGLGLAPFRCVGAYSLPSAEMAEKNPAAYQNALREMPKGWGIGDLRVLRHGPDAQLPDPLG